MANKQSTRNRIIFAEKRLNDLRHLNNGNIIRASFEEKQQLIQEFFFHLVGAIDFLFHVVNDRRNLNLPEEQVNRNNVCESLRLLNSADPIIPILNELHPTTLRNGRYIDLPTDFYTESNNHFRIMLYRHRVCHCGDNPFNISFRQRVHSISLIMDPRDHMTGHSQINIFDELELFLNLIKEKTNRVLKLI